jgi:hypothetical protein
MAEEDKEKGEWLSLTTFLSHLAKQKNWLSLTSWLGISLSPKGLFGSEDIHWLAGDIHFFSGCPTFGLEDVRDRGNQISGIFPQKSG